MVWEILAVWAVVTAALVWFFRDERRQTRSAALNRAAKYYAKSVEYRHQPSTPDDLPAAAPEPKPVPAKRMGGLTENDRAFVKAFSQSH